MTPLKPLMKLIGRNMTTYFFAARPLILGLERPLSVLSMEFPVLDLLHRQYLIRTERQIITPGLLNKRIRHGSRQTLIPDRRNGTSLLTSPMLNCRICRQSTTTLCCEQ